MKDDLEAIIRQAMRQSSPKGVRTQDRSHCITDEELACYVDGKALGDEQEQITSHVLKCWNCSEELVAYAKTLKIIDAVGETEADDHLVSKVMQLVKPNISDDIISMVIEIRDKAIELIQSTGDLLMGPRLIPVPALRDSAKKIGDKNSIRLVKKFGNVLTEIEIDKHSAQVVDLTIRLTNDKTKKKLSGIRIGLHKNNREIESLLTEAGRVKFEQIKAAVYKIDLTDDEKSIGVIQLTLQSG